MEHECSQSENLREIKREIFGNGRPGLKEEVANLKTRMEITVTTIEKIDAKMDTLLDFHNEYKGALSYKNKVTDKNRWLIGTLIAFGTIIVSLLIFIIEK
jgi:hypothetical protein